MKMVAALIMGAAIRLRPIFVKTAQAAVSTVTCKSHENGIGNFADIRLARPDR
jgi:hypothetical protein